jgi:hypothetical protein
VVRLPAAEPAADPSPLELACDPASDRLRLAARGVALAEVLRAIREACGIEVENRSRSALDEPTNVAFDGVPLATALDRLLDAYDKAFTWSGARSPQAPARLARVLVLAPRAAGAEAGAPQALDLDRVDALVVAVDGEDDGALAILAAQLSAPERALAAERLAERLASDAPADAAAPEAQARAARALGLVGDSASEAVLVDAFLHGERRVRDAAAASLQRLRASP